jgi:hypothetical protein
MNNLRPLLLCMVAIFALVETASALPKFSSRTGWKCQACHVNPSGGGMRSAGGVTYGREELPVPTWSEEFALDEFSTQLTDFIGIGADARTLFFYQQDPTEDNNAFFQMQGDIYLNLRLAKKVNLYVDKGLYSGFEIFGQANVIPANGFIKAGKFVPNYGLKLDEHRAYIREYTGLSQETGSPYFTGAEVAISPGGATVTGGIYNSADGRGASTGSDKAFLGRAEGLYEVSDDVVVGVGGNILYKDVQGGKNVFVGGLGSFSYDTFTLTGEVDMLRKDESGAKTDGLVIYGEADYMVVQGLDLKVIYDFYDPDLDVKTGSFSRYSFGFEFFPIAGVEVRPLYRINQEDPTDSTNDEFHLLLHFYL